MDRKKRFEIFDLKLDSLTMEETIQEVKKYIENGVKCQHVVLNAGKVVLANKNENLRNVINDCEIINADGQSVVWAARFLGNRIPERVAGIDLMYNLLSLAEKNGYGVYFFGAREEVLGKAIQAITGLYPKLIVSGKRNGYFTDKDIASIIEDMNNSKAKMLFVGFSSPMKEFWLKQHMPQINIPFCMGVGGSFDVAAGTTKRAPLWMQKLGLEWFYRFLQEPGRMWRRYLVGNMEFIKLTIKAKLSKAG